MYVHVPVRRQLLQHVLQALSELGRGPEHIVLEHERLITKCIKLLCDKQRTPKTYKYVIMNTITKNKLIQF